MFDVCMQRPRETQCHDMAFVARSCACRSDFRRRSAHAAASPPAPLPSAATLLRVARVDAAALDNADGRESLLEALVRDGVVLLRAPPAEMVDAVRQAAYSATRSFFARPFDEKALHGAGSGVGQLHGWMSYLDDPEGSECFEAKLNHDARFAWPLQPQEFRAATVALQQLLLRTALAALASCLSLDMRGVLDEHVEPGRLPGKSEARGAPPPHKDLADASHSALRVWSYSRGKPSGWHCDNSLLTIAPRGTCPGLVVRSLSGHTLHVEKQMRDDDLLLFAGDALSYLTAGRIRALMHQVVPPTSSHDAAPRMSAPFFLRGRQAAMLRAEPPSASLPPLRVSDLEFNAGNIRSQWSWKRDEYFVGQEWHAPET